jgi:putative transposase
MMISYLHKSLDRPVSHEIDGIRVPLLPPAGRLPSFRQFLHWYKENILSKQQHLVPESPLLPLCFSSARGDSSTGSIFGPGSRYQVIAITCDIPLVSSLPPHYTIGRPITYLAFDAFSQMIAGVHVSLASPNWEGVFRCLLNAILDKVPFCLDHGLEISEAQWPTRHLPATLFVDDPSEFAGDSAAIFDHLLASLSTRVISLSPPDNKHVVFLLKSRQYATQLTSTLQQRLRQGLKEGQPDIEFTLEQYWLLILLLANRHNRAEWMEWYPLDADMTADHIAPYPLDLWHWGIQHRTGQLRQIDQALRPPFVRSERPGQL